MKTRAPSSLPHFAAWIMYCCSPNPTSKLFWKNCAPMSMPKAPTTLQTPYRNAPSPRGSASEWPSLVTRRITPRENSWSPFARRRMPEPRFLVVRLGSLGDIVHTFPAVAGLHESFPNAEIVWLTHPRWKALVESSKLARDIWETETRSYHSLREIIGQIRGENFTAAIDYQGLWKSAALPYFWGVSCRIGISSQKIREIGVPILYTDRVRWARTHIADNSALDQLMALLKNAVCIVGGDTGPLHLAVALGTPAIAIFGPTDPARNGPYRMGDRSGNASPIDIVLRSPHAVTTYKRSGQAAPSILEIDVDTVFDAVRRQVEVRP